MNHYANEKSEEWRKINMHIIAELILTNGLEICVWKHDKIELYDVDVVDPDDIWNNKFNQSDLDAESVIRHISWLKYAK